MTFCNLISHIFYWHKTARISKTICHFVLFQDFIRRCIERDPQKRPGSRELLFHAVLFEVHSLKLLAGNCFVKNSCKQLCFLPLFLTEFEVMGSNDTRFSCLHTSSHFTFEKYSSYSIQECFMLLDITMHMSLDTIASYHSL